MAEVVRELGNPRKFVSMLREAIAKNPGSVLLENALGSQLTALGDQNGATAVYEAARAAGDLPAADVATARIDLNSGSLDAAKQRLTALTRNNDNAAARMLLAEIENRQGSPGNAIQHYLKAMEMEPSNVAAMNNLATIIPTDAITKEAPYFGRRRRSP